MERNIRLYIGTMIMTLLGYYSLFGQEYKAMMEDYSINFYDVVAAGNAYFKDRDQGKGSGWKGFQRWIYANEPLFAPSGDRSRFNPTRIANAAQQIKRSMIPIRSTDYNWKDLGPYYANNYTAHWSPGIGRVECVYVDPNNTNLIYMSSRSGGFWKSVDGGNSWINTTDGLPATGVNTFAVNPDNVNDILINIRFARNGTTQGIYRSLDGGITWNLTGFNPNDIGVGGDGTNHRVNEIVFHPSQPDTIFVVSTEGTYRSTDNFATFSEVASISSGSLEVHPTNPNIIYLSQDYYWSRNKFWRSLDGGNTFTMVVELAANDYSYPRLTTTPQSPNSLYFTSGKGIWKSSDMGGSFTYFPGSDQYGNTFGISDVDSNIMIKGVLDVYRSTDHGNNWTQSTDWRINVANNNYVHADMRFVYPLNGDFYIGTDGYVAKTSDDGVTWSILSDGTGIRENYKFGLCQSDNGIATCGSQDNGSSYYDNGQWIEWIGADGMEQIIHPMNPDFAIGNIQNGSKYRTTDRAQSIQNINGNHAADDFYWVAPLAFNHLDFNTIYSVGKKIHRSSDFGNNWILLDSFPDKATEMETAFNNKNTMYISVDEELHKSIDGGNTFARIDLAAGLPTYDITDIALSPQDDNMIVLTYGNYRDNNQRIYRSTNGGTTFSNISYNLSPIPALCVIIDNSASPNIYIGTEVGVYVLESGSTSYQLFSNNLPPVAIEEMEINFMANSLKAVSWGRGLWETTLLNRSGYPKLNSLTFNHNLQKGLPKSFAGKANILADTEAHIDSININYSVNNILLDQHLSTDRISLDEFSFSLPSGNEGDTIYFQIIGANSAGLTKSYRFMYPIIADQDYCSAQGASGTGSDYIINIGLGDDNNPSGKTAYSDFTNVVFEVDRFGSETLSMELYAAFSIDAAHAWVDWDNNRDFVEAEAITMGSFVNRISSGELSVPLWVTPGDYRCRTRVIYGSSDDPCGSYFGEVEDYTIRVVDGACPDEALVDTKKDFVPGSLRFWVDNGCVGDTIYFAESLVNDTISLWNGIIDINRNLTIAGHQSTHTTLSGLNFYQLFDLNAAVNLTNLKLINTISNSNGGAFVNRGDLTLRDVIFETNKEGSTDKAFTNFGTIEILPGVTVIKK